MRETDARKKTEQVKIKLERIADDAEAVIKLMHELYEGEAYKALGYHNHTAYVEGEFSAELGRLPKGELEQFVVELKKQELPNTAIAEVMSVSEGTVRNAANSQNYEKAEPSKVTRTDGLERKSTSYRATDEEKARRRPITAKLWKEGFTRDQICEALGISHGTVTEDRLAMGIDSGHRPATILARAQNKEPSGDLRWRNSETDTPPPAETKPSKIVQTETSACYIRPASDVIMGVEADLEELTGGRYELSLKDRTDLINVLQTALGRVTNGVHQSKDSRLAGRAGA